MVSISVCMTRDMYIYAFCESNYAISNFYESNYPITGFGPYRLQHDLPLGMHTKDEDQVMR